MAKDSGDVGSTEPSAAKTSSPKSKSEWPEPQAGWIPIGKAVFRFGIADTDAPTSQVPAAPADLFSVETFERSKGREGVSKIGYEPEQPTLEYLTELLRKNADASKAEIDREEGKFLFSFTLSGGGAACHGGTPWAILREPDESLKLNPRLEALLNNSGLASDYEAPYEGFARISNDEAAEGARQSEGARLATGLVWRRLMLPAFDRAVKAGRVKLFARAPSPRDDFQTLPSDIWPQLEVVDWEHGVACDMQGTLYSSIHVADNATPIDKSGGQSFKAADAALVEEMRSLITQGRAKNVSDAARQVAAKAMGLGSTDSIVERLRRAYGVKYPTRKRS
jgi:hypothetical protein